MLFPEMPQLPAGFRSSRVLGRVPGSELLEGNPGPSQFRAGQFLGKGTLKNTIRSSLICFITYCLLPFFFSTNTSSVRSETEGSLACRIHRMENGWYLAKVWTQSAFQLIPLNCGVAPSLSSEFHPDSVLHCCSPSGPQGQP